MDSFKATYFNSKPNNTEIRMIAKIYLTPDSANEKKSKDVYSFAKIIGVKRENKVLNQHVSFYKIYQVHPVYERPEKIDKYLSIDAVISFGELKIFRDEII